MIKLMILKFQKDCRTQMKRYVLLLSLFQLLFILELFQDENIMHSNF